MREPQSTIAYGILIHSCSSRISSAKAGNLRSSMQRRARAFTISWTLYARNADLVDHMIQISIESCIRFQQRLVNVGTKAGVGNDSSTTSEPQQNIYTTSPQPAPFRSYPFGPLPFSITFKVTKIVTSFAALLNINLYSPTNPRSI